MRKSYGVIDEFKVMLKDAGIPCQNVIDLYLLYCAGEGRPLALKRRR